jgi:hypothetical protein
LKTTRHARRLALAAVPILACVFGAQKAGAQESPMALQRQAVANTQQVLNAQLAQRPDAGATTRGDTSTAPQQFDLTPVKLPERGSAFANMQSFRMGALYYLPSKMFFDATVENSLRLETNAFQTEHRNKPDMIYRILPNVTLGYAPTRTTRISANYFFFRDQYTQHANVLSHNIHSVGLRGDKDWILNSKTTLTTSFFARELFISGFDELSDLLPSATLVRRVGSSGAVYASALGQLRWRNVFGAWQEGDTFFSVGGVRRTPKWTFVFDTTLIDNYGRPALRGGVANNHVIVVSMEAGRKISQRLPMTAFIRAEPIFNIGQAERQGFAGVNFRLFGGIRAEISKPAIFPVALGSG